MDIKKVNSAINLDKTALTSNAKEVEKKAVENETEHVAVESKLTTRKDVVSDVELNAILENLVAAESKVTDVDKADEMIRQANKKILENRNEAVLSQANQSKDVVEKLTK